MRLYGINDMVKTGCHDCAGCSACCRGMGDTILLDPFDIYRLTGGLHKSFAELLAFCAELHVEEGVIRPNLKMSVEDESCVFLNEEGRCSIHGLRPGLCRTFPLGRNYEDGKLSYFPVEGECLKENKTKQKVSKWLDTPQLNDYQEFLVKWHYLIKELQGQVPGLTEDELKAVNMLLLKIFYLEAYGEDDFYIQFEERLNRFKKQAPSVK